MVIELIINILITFINLIASLASIITFYKTHGAKKTKTHINTQDGHIHFLEINETFNLSETIDLDFDFIDIIDKNILKAAYDKIKNAKRRFIDALNNPNYTSEDLDREAAIASATICEVLNLIKRHNRNKLPNIKKLNDIWLSFRCI